MGLAISSGTSRVWAQREQEEETYQGIMATATVGVVETPVMICYGETGLHGIHKQRLLLF